MAVVASKSEEAKITEGRDWFQVLAIFLACMSSMIGGMLFSWSSPSIPKIVEDKVNYDITLEEASYFTVLPSVGVILSCGFYSKLNDLIGRKYTILLIAIPYAISWILIFTARSVYVFYIARLCNGIGDAGIFSSVPTYVGEVATPKVRGSWGNFVTFFLYLGQLWITLIGSYFSVVHTAYIGIVFPIIFICTFAFMPETPYYYLMKGRVDDARASLQRLRRIKDVENELTKLKGDVQRQMSESGTWKDLFTIKSNRKALYAGVFLRASQQFAGVATFAVYTQYIFLKSGGSLSASTSSIIYVGLTTVLNFCAGFSLDRIGRRKSYFVSVLVCGFCLLGVAIYFSIEQFFPDVNLENVKWIPLAGLIFFVVLYSFGLGIIPTLMLGELFSTSIKGKGLIVLNIVFALLVSTITKLFQVLDTNFGLFCPFLFFAMCCFISSALTYRFVPETKGKTLEEIQQDLRGAKKCVT